MVARKTTTMRRVSEGRKGALTRGKGVIKTASRSTGRGRALTQSRSSGVARVARTQSGTRQARTAIGRTSSAISRQAAGRKTTAAQRSTRKVASRARTNGYTRQEAGRLGAAVRWGKAGNRSAFKSMV